MNNPYFLCDDTDLRILAYQWVQAGRWEKLGLLLSDLEYAEAKATRLGIDLALEDYILALRTMPEADDWYEVLRAAYSILSQEVHHLRSWDMSYHPAYFLQQVLNSSWFGQMVTRF